MHDPDSPTIEPLPEDVVTRVQQEYGERADEVLSLLHQRRRRGDGDFFGDRLIRCVVFAAQGDISRLTPLIKLGIEDDRNLIIAGEYGGNRDRRRDLTTSFLIDSEEKFWICGVAELMSLRRSRLTSLETSPASGADSRSDDSERRATFVGPKGTIQIARKDRHWRVCGDRQTLELHRLSQRFDSSTEFQDALSGMLLSRYPLPEPRDREEAPSVEPSQRPWWKFWG